MYLTFYNRRPHPHKGNFKTIESLPEAWKFKLEYGEHVCERKFSQKNELIRAKCNYRLPQDQAKGKMLSTMAFIDFYAGPDQSGYFSFSINRSFPVGNETMSQLEAKGHDLAISDCEKMIEAIRAGLSGKAPQQEKQPSEQQQDPERWLTLSPAEIVKTHFTLQESKISSPLFAPIAKLTDLRKIRAIENLDQDRLNCLTSPDLIYCFSSFKLNDNSMLFVAQSGENAVCFSQIADGKVVFSPTRIPDEALAEACRIVANGLPDNWITFRQKISPQEFMILRALSSLSSVLQSKPELQGFTLGQILLEMGNPIHVSSIGIMPKMSRNSLFSATLNRNDVAVGLLTLRAEHFIKRTYIAGNHYFALSTSGKELTSMFAPENQLITISLQKSKDHKGFQEDSAGCLAVFASSDSAISVYLSQSGDIFSAMSSSIGDKKISPVQAIAKLIKIWL